MRISVPKPFSNPPVRFRFLIGAPFGKVFSGIFFSPGWDQNTRKGSPIWMDLRDCQLLLFSVITLTVTQDPLISGFVNRSSFQNKTGVLIRLILWHSQLSFKITKVSLVELGCEIRNCLCSRKSFDFLWPFSDVSPWEESWNSFLILMFLTFLFKFGHSALQNLCTQKYVPQHSMVLLVWCSWYWFGISWIKWVKNCSLDSSQRLFHHCPWLCSFLCVVSDHP